MNTEKCNECPRCFKKYTYIYIHKYDYLPNFEPFEVRCRNCSLIQPTIELAIEAWNTRIGDDLVDKKEFDRLSNIESNLSSKLEYIQDKINRENDCGNPPIEFLEIKYLLESLYD